MRNPKISAARAARAEYRQKLKRLAVGASIARDIYSQALRELAIDKFVKLHPKENWPEWMEKRAEYKVQFDESNICKVSITIRVDGPMPEGLFWRETIHGRLLACLDENGETRFIISGGGQPLEIITVFEAYVDPESLVVSVTIDRDPSAMILPPPEFFYDGW
ncbi:hypothetical protein [Chamaesiphon minutus]|uniref:Uncharacterized protein n=1 Tax=Chamaesiphon minutus (strain ATCC 27169 / PCC 6605) TaxID=1173020 RepID=K9UB60_CHAP6|nr:hypothetical protein [Chamaesiphon minutus]AFY92080.1 hypothetical protein Cha6605_0819 [Chamaesiphon minutus PCC 6605]